MDNIYRLQRHIYDVTRRYYLLGRDQMLNQLDVPQNGSVLEIGCGTGRNIVRVAQRFPTARLFGLDISEEMLKSATAAIERHGLRGRVIFANADATNFQPELCFGQAKFDRIFFSYTLSMVPDWQGALQHALKFLAPDGELHIVDFGQCASLPKSFKHSLATWLKIFHVYPRSELKTKLEELSRANGLNLEFGKVYRDYAWLFVSKKKQLLSC